MDVFQSWFLLGDRIYFAQELRNTFGTLPLSKSFAKATGTSLLYANALPEPVFKYSSKSLASFFVVNPAYQTSFHGMCGFVDFTFPWLCRLNLIFRFFDEPK